jgi:hypothetical protein
LPEKSSFIKWPAPPRENFASKISNYQARFLLLIDEEIIFIPLIFGLKV